MPRPRKTTQTNMPSISNAEWLVMKTLWKGDALAARDVYARLPEGHGWAYKTVKTLLSRLVAKGAIGYEQVGNSYLYRATHSREQVTRHEVRDFVDRVLDGSALPVLAHFIEQGNLSDEEIAGLREMLNRTDAVKPKRKGK